MNKRIFIVRPFGIQEGVDFDAVERDLIRPAIERVKASILEGGTTIPLVQQGNIREDMFRELVTADLVVADVSIHNANVFYELGIRHGLRPTATFLLRADIDKYPFDLQTDRYLAYNQRDPGKAVDQLARALDATLTSGHTDSPVYQLLPSLAAPDPAALRIVPSEFGEAVDLARDGAQNGDLRLLAYEAKTFSWASEGLRAAGRAQFTLNEFRGARETFEWLRELRPDDVEANQRLATIYQRLARDEQNPDYLARSNLAIQRVIESPIPGSWDIAEAYALKARNSKMQWLHQVKPLSGSDAQAAALRAPELVQALENYWSGFAQDLNHFYSGLNALSLLRIRLDLARVHPTVWAEAWDTDDEARRALESADARFIELAGAVRLAIDASRIALQRRKKPDDERRLWTEISAADLAFLTGTRPRAVAQRYREALLDAPSFARGAVRDQLEIFLHLGVRVEFVQAALPAVDNPDHGESRIAIAAVPPGRVLLFTGHMVDAPDRREPRFPPTPQAEAEAKRLIREAVARERDLEPVVTVGIAGGACGGDILFHEVCAELGIESRLFLALPPDVFRAESVQRGGPQWVERFSRLSDRLTPRMLADKKNLPGWLAGKEGYDIWQRNNLWMLFNALSLDAKRLTLIALWDGGRSDGPGGTENLVAQVQARGHKVERLPAEQLKMAAARSSSP